MSIKLPKEIIYFYEITQISDRLLYCIPFKQLQTIVKKDGANEQILYDYPKGVDIKVSSMHFSEFTEQYRMKFNIDPELLWRAFKLIKSKTKRKFYGTGFIKKEFLEKLAKEIQPDFEEYKGLLPLIDGEEATLVQKKRIQRKIISNHKKMKKHLSKKTIEYIDVKKPMNRQVFSEIKMSQGEDAFDFMSKIKQRK